MEEVRDRELRRENRVAEDKNRVAEKLNRAAVLSLKRHRLASPRTGPVPDPYQNHIGFFFF